MLSYYRISAIKMNTNVNNMKRAWFDKHKTGDANFSYKFCTVDNVKKIMLLTKTQRCKIESIKEASVIKCNVMFLSLPKYDVTNVTID